MHAHSPRSPRDPPQQPVALEGFLSKQGGGSSAFGRKSWKVRYFTLKRGVLSYFIDKKEAKAGGKPRGSAHVLSITSIKHQGPTTRVIELPNRALVVRCDQEEILRKWVDAINAHVRYERRTEHLKNLQIEARMVEEEMSQQMCFSIMYNVLKRWITIEFQRTLQVWRMNIVAARYGDGVAGDITSARLRQQLESEKRDEMAKFTEAMKEKWEESIVCLKEEMQSLREEAQPLPHRAHSGAIGVPHLPTAAHTWHTWEVQLLKADNSTLRAENSSFREEAGVEPLLTALGVPLALSSLSRSASGLSQEEEQVREHEDGSSPAVDASSPEALVDTAGIVEALRAELAAKDEELTLSAQKQQLQELKIKGLEEGLQGLGEELDSTRKELEASRAEVAAIKGSPAAIKGSPEAEEKAFFSVRSPGKAARRITAGLRGLQERAEVALALVNAVEEDDDEPATGLVAVPCTTMSSLSPSLVTTPTRQVTPPRAQSTVAASISQSTKSPSPSASECTWITRYKAIVNSPAIQKQLSRRSPE